MHECVPLFRFSFPLSRSFERQKPKKKFYLHQEQDNDTGKACKNLLVRTGKSEIQVFFVLVNLEKMNTFGKLNIFNREELISSVFHFSHFENSRACH